MKVKVNKDICIGCGAWTDIANGYFKIGDDGLAEVNDIFQEKDVPENEEENVQDATDSCPTSAIEEI
jgi:ferredoxin